MSFAVGLRCVVGLSLLIGAATRAEVRSYMLSPELFNKGNACQISLCGPSELNWTAETYLKRRGGQDQNVVRLWQDKLKPLMIQSFDQREQAAVLQAKVGAELLKKPESWSLSDNGHAVLVYWKLKSTLTRDGGAVVRRSVDKSVVDPSSLRAFLETRPEAEHQAIAMMADHAAMTATFRAKDMNETKGLWLTRRLQRLYSSKVSESMALKLDARALVKKAIELRKILSEELGQSEVPWNSVARFNRAATLGVLSVDEAVDYVTSAANVDALARILLDPEKMRILASVPLNLSEEMQAVSGSAWFQDFLKTDIHEAVTADTTVISNMCERHLHNSLAANASPLRYRRLAEIAEQVRALAKTMVPKIAESAGQEGVLKALDDVQFLFPSTNQTRIEEITKAFEVEASETKRSLEIAKTPGRERDQRILFMMLALKYGLHLEMFKAASPISAACAALPIEAISDNTHFPSRRISLSWYSANYPEVGIAIVAHEIGHVISDEVRRQQNEQKIENPEFTRIYSCVADRNPYGGRSSSFDKLHSNFWSEEDWADHFSSMLMNELKAQGSPWGTVKNKACGLLRLTEDGTSYLSSLVPSETDAHATGFMRLLSIAQDRGMMTPECLIFVDDFTQHERNWNCK